jgi:type I restriction-modification system DNA methylase subunit/REP element-mobilizing transposase RayT
MSLFQNSVLQKYLNRLDASVLDAKYNEFTAYFGNPAIQENIRNSKEEQFQEGFLRELFVKILGYTLNPSANFNLTTEYKNVKDSKKADGAIVVNDVVKAVIELKGTSITDLGKVEAQAFGYKNNQPDCVYVITSNFEKLRFYVDNAIEFEEFNLFSLTKNDFGMLYVCLSYDAILKGIPKAIKTESLSQEDTITKKLYQDYSLFKRELHQNLVKQNPQYDSLTLFKESQKLLDRFLFLFFAEDRQLLPPNSVRLILNDWRDLQERDEAIPLYNRFKKYFGYLNTGFKGKRYDVFAYNGGLFKPDDILDSVTIDDELLFKHTMTLSEYDFVSEVDVNILGHIFENSLNELDEIKARIEGHDVDKTKTRRKKEGIFYTPKYITKYIVENTIGKLCTEKKAELQLNEEDYTSDRKRNVKTKQSLADKLKTYRTWLLQLTICDPACGSGAFLNQALDFLITEHRHIDELQARLFGDSFILSDIEKSILENNLFGVDLNEESVEIAKLSLWLRTAQPNRKLNDLNKNIKCGNSLIDDPAIAGDKAFNWQIEFPKVFSVKDKKAWHITCATHNSRYSQRMFDNYVKLGEPVWLTTKEEIIVSETIAEISAKDKLNIPAYNICGDHMHLILVCEETELPSIVQKIKSMSARACNIAMGRTVPREHAPAAPARGETMEHRTREHAPVSIPAGTAPATREHAPSSSPAPPAASPRGETQAHLWTQKFGQNEITSEKQLHKTIRYIRNNRIKHGLPELGKEGTGALSAEPDKGACSLVTIAPGTAPATPPDSAPVTAPESPPAIAPGSPVSAPVDSSIDAGACSGVVDRICCSIDHAFRTEYAGGFDVVIGNPPYVDIKALPKNIVDHIFKKFKTANNRINLFSVFIEKGLDLLKEEGKFSFIIPSSLLTQESYKPIRNELLSNSHINNIVRLPNESFGGSAGEVKVDTIIFTFTNTKLIDGPVEVFVYKGFNRIDSITSFNCDEHVYIDQSDWKKDENNIFRINSNGDIASVLRKIENETILLSKCADFCLGLTPYDKYKGHTSEQINKRVFHAKSKKDETYKKLLAGNDVTRYNIEWNGEEWISYGKWLGAPREEKFFTEKRILVKQIIDWTAKRIWASMTTEELYNAQNAFNLIANGYYQTEYLLAILNSKLMAFYHKKKFLDEYKDRFQKILIKDCKNFPIRTIGYEQQQPYTGLIKLMLSLNKDLLETSQKFQRTIQRKFTLSELSNKLRDWYLLTYAGFIAELAKKKVKLSLSEEAEWEAYFIQESGKALDIKAKIEATDREIDQMVYKLYELSGEEIKIVEGK